MRFLEPLQIQAADLANAGIYALEGDYVNATISAGSAIPAAGNFVTAGKWAAAGSGVLAIAVKYGDDAVEHAGEVKLTRRVQKPGDMDLASEPETLQEALRQHNVPKENMDLIERVPDYDQGLVGPKGEPAEKIYALDVDGNIAEIKHHANGHLYPDNTYETPHYHGPKKVHLNYRPSLITWAYSFLTVV